MGWKLISIGIAIICFFLSYLIPISKISVILRIISFFTLIGIFAWILVKKEFKYIIKSYKRGNPTNKILLTILLLIYALIIGGTTIILFFPSPTSIALYLKIFFLLINCLLIIVIINWIYEILNGEVRGIRSLIKGYLVTLVASGILFSLWYFFIKYKELGDLISPIGTVLMWWDYIYFSFVTLFSLGYGDMAPQGLSKLLSIFEVLWGNFLIILVIAVGVRYLPLKKLKEE